MEKLVLGSMKRLPDSDCQFCAAGLFLPERAYGEPTNIKTFECGQEIVCKNCGVVQVATFLEKDDFVTFTKLKKPKVYEWCDTKALADVTKFFAVMLARCDAETIKAYLMLCVDKTGFCLEEVDSVRFFPKTRSQDESEITRNEP
jgi:hypothetical protein